MLKFSQVQLDAFANIKKKEYIAALSRYFTQEYSQYLSKVNDIGLTDFIIQSIEEARNFGFFNANHISKFTTLNLQLWPDKLSKLTWAIEVLTDKTLNTDLKVQALSEQVMLLKSYQ